MLRERVNQKEIGVITPYKAQEKMIRRKLNMPNIEVGTVDGFQVLITCIHVHTRTHTYTHVHTHTHTHEHIYTHTHTQTHTSILLVLNDIGQVPGQRPWVLFQKPVHSKGWAGWLLGAMAIRSRCWLPTDTMAAKDRRW